MINNIKIFCFWGLIFCSLQLSAQTKFTVSGTIKDKKTGEALIGVTVKAANKPSLGTSSNEYGFYSLTLPSGTYKLQIDYIGYKSQVLEVSPGKKSGFNISLEAGETELKEVQISGKTNNISSAQMGMTKMSIKELNAVPVIFGERDVLKTIQLLPGVQSVSDGNSGFYVRGGAADQNLILLDDAVVYNPSHLLGFFSTFNSDAIKDVTLYKGTAPAQYGGRLSSVLDVKMNDGNDQSYHISGGIGLISSKLDVEGPIQKDEGSFLITARRTYADLFLKLSPDTTLKKSSLYFYDLNAKLNYKLSDKDRIYLSGYFGQDDLGLGGIFGLNYGNATGTFRWNHILNDKMFSNTSVIYSDYDYNIGISDGGISANIQSIIRDWTLKQEFEYYANPDNEIRFGFNVIYHTIEPGNITGSGITNSTQPDNHSLENAIYISDSWKASPRLNIDYGLRVSTFSVMGGANLYDLNPDGSIKDTLHYGSGQIVQTYVVPEPRITGSYKLNNVSSLKMGYTRNSQYMHLISNSTTTNPTDKWVGSDNNIKPEIADQGTFGYFRSLKDDQYEFSAETYFKYMQNQIDYRNGAQVLDNTPLDPKLLFGDGRSYGLELFLKKKEGRFTGWISYTLSRSEIQIEGVNNDSWYPSRQDHTHDLSLVGIYQINKKWAFSSDFVFYTGAAVTFPSGKYLGPNGYPVFLYTSRDGYRMPDYNRLDFSFTKTLKPHKHYTSELVYSLYNAYGRENPYVIIFQNDPTDINKTQAVQYSLFRWVPSISYNFKF
jgi:hypothetical protein